MINTTHSLLLIAVMSVGTMLTRFLPFAFFRSEEKMPKALRYLSKVLPGAVMGMLVVYCYRATSFSAPTYALPEVIATAVVVLSYLWKKNTLLSIGAGTVLYMILVQLVFK